MPPSGPTHADPNWNVYLQTSEELGQTASLRAAFGHGLEVAVELRHHHIVPYHGFHRRVHQFELEAADDVGNGHVHFHVREAGHRSSLAECQSHELFIPIAQNKGFQGRDLLDAQARPRAARECHHEFKLCGYLLRRFHPAIRIEFAGVLEDVRVVVDVVNGHADTGAGGNESPVR